MRLVIQRVTSASVRVEGEVIGAIGAGVLVLVGVREGTMTPPPYRLATKTAEFRIFEDADGRFNRSLIDTRGEALVVSQFTLYGDVRRGRRPSFNDAAKPEVAEPLVEAYARALEALGVHVARGRFGAHMQVASINDGPVTSLIDSADFDKPRSS